MGLAGPKKKGRTRSFRGFEQTALSTKGNALIEEIRILAKGGNGGRGREKYHKIGTGRP